MTDYVAAIQKGDKQQIINNMKLLNALGERKESLPQTTDQLIDSCLREFVKNNGYLRPPKFKNLNPKESLSTFNKRVLLINGALDHSYIRDNVSFMRNKFPAVKVISIDNAAHLVNLEQPDLFNQHLATFLVN